MKLCKNSKKKKKTHNKVYVMIILNDSEEASH